MPLRFRVIFVAAYPYPPFYLFMPDITTEADIKLLIDSFYARVLADPLLAIL